MAKRDKAQGIYFQWPNKPLYYLSDLGQSIEKDMARLVRLKGKVERELKRLSALVGKGRA